MFLIGAMLFEKVVGQVEDLLELAVPCDQMLRFVEHGHAVAHVLERDAEFFLALADFIQQPRVLHRDHRLRGEVLQQGDLLVGERRGLPGGRRDEAEQGLVLPQRHPEASAAAPGPTSLRDEQGRRSVGLVLHPIEDVDRRSPREQRLIGMRG